MKYRSRILLTLATAVLVPFFWLATVRFITFENAENSTDCFYHITIAEQGPSTFCSKTFPAMTSSIWNKQFYDKELVFHFILFLIRKGERALCGNCERAPFHLPALIFTFLFMVSFVFTANHFKIPWLPFFAMLLVVICPFFTNRLLMLRPHVLSMSILVFSCVLFHCYRPGKLNGVVVLAVGFLFAWTYSNPHFLLIPAVAFAVARYRELGKRAWLLPLLTFAGLVAGYIIHPQFPNTFINWKIQCIDVFIQSLSGRLPVTLGNELSGPDTNWLMFNSLFLLLGMANLVMAVILVLKVPFNKLSEPFLAFMMLAVPFYLGSFFGMRATEYGCPFNIIFTGLIIKELKEREIKLPTWLWNRYRPIQLVILLVTLSLLVAEIQYHFRAENVKRIQLREVPELVHRKIPPGTLIANLIWSDFPFLYNTLPDYRFLFGLDPMFAYKVNPEIVTKLDRFCRAKLTLSPQELSKLVHARYVYIGKYFLIGKLMKAQGYNLLYEGEEGWLFDLKTSGTGQKKEPEIE